FKLLRPDEAFVAADDLPRRDRNMRRVCKIAAAGWRICGEGTEILQIWGMGMDFYAIFAI
ncbi:MAG: hypothetical protein K2H21_02880, partial [Muribaculaceae bacterium]|nr:hypothetical protein [Muribaculaceae bacterium]